MDAGTGTNRGHVYRNVLRRMQSYGDKCKGVTQNLVAWQHILEAPNYPMYMTHKGSFRWNLVFEICLQSNVLYVIMYPIGNALL